MLAPTRPSSVWLGLVDGVVVDGGGGGDVVVVVVVVRSWPGYHRVSTGRTLAID